MGKVRIVHKLGKVESDLFTDVRGNIINGITYKYYGNYFQNAESKADEKERKRILNNLPLLFYHERDILALANRKGLPAVKLICDRPDPSLEMEYLDGVPLHQCLASAESNPVERRHLITETIRCINKYHNSGIFLGDPHPSNFLIEMTGKVVFCDFGNAFSPLELPFNTPPLASGNQVGRRYFSDVQHKAFVDDHRMDRAELAAPYPPEKLASNRLGAKDDCFVFAHHVLQIQAQIRDAKGSILENIPASHLFDAELINILEGMKCANYATGEEILRKLYETAPDKTPEIDSCEELIIPKKPFSLPDWKFEPIAATKRLLLGVSTLVMSLVIGVVAVFGIGATYEVFRHGTILGFKVPPNVVIQPVPAVVKTADQINPKQKSLDQFSEQLMNPVSSQEYRNTLRRLAQMKTPEAGMMLEKHLAKTIADADSSQIAQANIGIKALHLIAGVKSPVSHKAVAAIGDVIKKTIQTGPSEESSQRLELLASLGNVRAHHALAGWLESGNGLKGRNLAAAYRHYVAASRKIADAAKVVARMESVAPVMVKSPSTRQEGIQLLLAIAERPQNKVAQCIVGCIYAEGKYGLSPNQQLAKDYLTRSARNGFVEAKAALKYYKLQG